MKKPSLNEELLQSREKILTCNFNAELLSVLRTKIPEMTDMIFIVDWIPEQTEDIFTIVVDGNKVVNVEMSRDKLTENPLSFEVKTVQEYFKNNRGGYQNMIVVNLIWPFNFQKNYKCYGYIVIALMPT